ncbi:hypothetical protein [Leucobacter luti]|uniref:Uncharacterized protein n=1 Tax=Leucobacter luti TaxID=340320 RepID=A0A4R6S9B1_9MICO|nr:hypothetical protein [Leucobacter luti]MCW2288857.1 hypothetical protein [Leucobacter luti]QYM75246.1 hypothetical protein K1X41_11375 [Leucobacter luti]TCK44992.1 hypothetical protein EDF60_0211 [Leucobacter luti]TDP95516.1 hypothetical protein EDF62_0205 [Leucobacter luti]
MSTPDASDPQTRQDPAPQAETPVAASAPAAARVPAEPVTAAPEHESEEPEPVVVVAEREVTLQRSVRYGRVIVGLALLGAVVGMIASAFFPILDDANYTLGQIAGFMALIGGAIGLFLGGVLALILGVIARRTRGRGVAIQSDVR